MSTHADIKSKLEELTDLEFAILLCLLAREHCLIDTPVDNLGDLANELLLISRDIFGLSNAVIDCTIDTSVDDFFYTAVQNNKQKRLSTFTHADNELLRPTDASQREDGSSLEGSRLSISNADGCQLANIIIAKNFDRVSHGIQIQVLELLRSKRVHTRTAIYDAPDDLIFIPIISSNTLELSSRLNKHLNEHISISHYHDPSVGFTNLEGDGTSIMDDGGSLSSVIRTPSFSNPLIIEAKQPLIVKKEINFLRKSMQGVTVSTEVYCYVENIINFLRFNRAVFSGITAPATRQFHKIIKCLASLHSVDYVPPSLVALAVKKIYRHRIAVASPQEDRSMMYGSDIHAVEVILSSTTPESIIEDVLSEVEAPL